MYINNLKNVCLLVYINIYTNNHTKRIINVYYIYIYIYIPVYCKIPMYKYRHRIRTRLGDYVDIQLKTCINYVCHQWEVICIAYQI